jgi:hypothetical protein
MNSHSVVPDCPDLAPEYLKEGFDVHLHIGADGTVTVLSSTPHACSEGSPHDWWLSMINRGFAAFSLKPGEEVEVYEN